MLSTDHGKSDKPTKNRTWLYREKGRQPGIAKPGSLLRTTLRQRSGWQTDHGSVTRRKKLIRKGETHLVRSTGHLAVRPHRLVMITIFIFVPSTPIMKYGQRNGGVSWMSRRFPIFKSENPCASMTKHDDDVLLLYPRRTYSKLSARKKKENPKHTASWPCLS